MRSQRSPAHLSEGRAAQLLFFSAPELKTDLTVFAYARQPFRSASEKNGNQFQSSGALCRAQRP